MAWYDFLMGPAALGINALAGGQSAQNVGQGVQSAASGVKKAVSGTPARTEQVPLYTPQQQQAIQQFLGAGLGGLGQLGQLGQQQFRVPSSAIGNLFQQTLAGTQGPNLSFEPIAAAARRQFQTSTVPSIAERFASLGSGGSQRSSAFANQLGSASADLESQLAALGAQYGLQSAGLQNRQQLLRQQLLSQLLGSQAQQFGQQGQLFQNLAQLGLQSPFQNQYHPRIPGLLENLASSAASGLGSALPLLFL